MDVQNFTLKVEHFSSIQDWVWTLFDSQSNPLESFHVQIDASSSQFQAAYDLYNYVSTRASLDKSTEDENSILSSIGKWIGSELLGTICQQLFNNNAPKAVHVALPQSMPSAHLILNFPLELAHFEGQPIGKRNVSFIQSVDSCSDDKIQGDQIQIVSAFSQPVGTTALNLHFERTQISEVINRLVADSNLNLNHHSLQYGVTRQALEEFACDCDILHLSGHGGAGRFALELSNGAPDILTASELVELLSPARKRLKLVVLSACQSAAQFGHRLELLGMPQTEIEEILRLHGYSASTSASAKLISQELGCAVLAMRYPVSDHFAIRLAKSFYTEFLSQNQSIAGALQRALQNAHSKSDLEVCNPTLIGQTASNLHAFPTSKAETQTPVQAHNLGIRPVTFVGRVRELACGNRVLSSTSGKCGAFLFGVAGCGKSTAALELAWNNAYLNIFDYIFWHEIPERVENLRQSFVKFASLLNHQYPSHFQTVNLFDDDSVECWLHELEVFINQVPTLIGIDNLNVALDEHGNWKSEWWRLLYSTLANSRSKAKLIVTSRSIPKEKSTGAVEMEFIPVNTLSARESLLLANQLKKLPRLIDIPNIQIGNRSLTGPEIFRRSLEFASGHPKLLEIVDEQSNSPSELAQLLVDLENHQLDFKRESNNLNPDSTDPGLQISSWTTNVLETLEEHQRNLFYIFSHLSKEDRQDEICRDICRHLERQHGISCLPEKFDESLNKLISTGLVQRSTEQIPINEPKYGTYFKLHPMIAESGRQASSVSFDAAFSREIIGFWERGFIIYLSRESTGLSLHVATATFRVASYALIAKSWDRIWPMVYQMLSRDRSARALSHAFAFSQQLKAATQGTEHEIFAIGLEAICDYVARKFKTAEEKLLQVFSDAKDSHPKLRSEVKIILINIYNETDRPAEARKLMNLEKRNDNNLGWDELFERATNLQILSKSYKHTEVLSLAPQVLQDMKRLIAAEQKHEELPDIEIEIDTFGMKEERIPVAKHAARILKDALQKNTLHQSSMAWHITEIVCNAAFAAASQLEQWDKARAYNEIVIQSKLSRCASPEEIARARFNDGCALFRAKRYSEARKVLLECRTVYRQKFVRTWYWSCRLYSWKY